MRLLRRHRQGRAARQCPLGQRWLASRENISRRQFRQLRPGAEGAADARHPRPLVQGQRRGHVEHLVHVRLGRLGHPPPGVGGKGLQIPPGALGVEHSQGQGGLSRAGHPRNPHNLVQGHVYVHVFQIVYPRAPDLDFLGPALPFSHRWDHPS